MEHVYNQMHYKWMANWDNGNKGGVTPGVIK